MEYTLILLAIFIVAISRAYYLDYKSDKEEFRFSLKNVGKKVLEYCFILLIIFGIKSAYNYFIPLNKNHGIEFNSEREKLGIPKIGDNWENRKYDSDQFTTQWWKLDSTDGHFKKVIEYGILNVESEIDYYKNDNQKGTFAWSKFDFGNNSTEYFIEKPNDKNVTITESGKLKIEKPTVIQKIDKSEFEKYIAK